VAQLAASLVKILYLFFDCFSLSLAEFVHLADIFVDNCSFIVVTGLFQRFIVAFQGFLDVLVKHSPV
jgi:hypothetical protein